jgi:NodT family efflux transporter outer membrane factor (OMF) lipoprotein
VRSLGPFGFTAALLALGLACSPAQAAPVETSLGTSAALQKAPERWQAALPHGGRVAELARWWQQFDDPLLAELIAAAESVSPNLASAGSRIAQARAERVGAGAGLQPSVSAVASASRSKVDVSLPVATSLSAGLQASWELDLFGGQRAARNAAEARLLGAEADWHDARVSLAADVADAYVGLRHCEALAAQADTQARSRADTARLSALSARAGFDSAASAALADASAAQAEAQAVSQRSACERNVKALVALSGWGEPSLRQRLTAQTARIPQPASIQVNEVPAVALAQRPDVYRTARAWEAATADLAQSEAQRWPKLSFAGSISPTQTRSAGARTEGTVWSVGPLQLSLPIWDGGSRSANIDSAQASLRAAASAHEAQVRQAVSEVEQALVRLAASGPGLAESQRAARGFRTAYDATAAKQKVGLASALELEDTRRSLAQADGQAVDAEQEQVSAWIALYRALGGGWAAVGHSSIPLPPTASAQR